MCLRCSVATRVAAPVCAAVPPHWRDTHAATVPNAAATAPAPRAAPTLVFHVRRTLFQGITSSSCSTSCRMDRSASRCRGSTTCARRTASQQIQAADPISQRQQQMHARVRLPCSCHAIDAGRASGIVGAAQTVECPNPRRSSRRTCRCTTRLPGGSGRLLSPAARGVASAPSPSPCCGMRRSGGRLNSPAAAKWDCRRAGGQAGRQEVGKWKQGWGHRAQTVATLSNNCPWGANRVTHSVHPPHQCLQVANAASRKHPPAAA